MKTVLVATFLASALGYSGVTNPPTSEPLMELKSTETKASKSKVKARNGDYLVMLYKGTLKDGTQFDGNTLPEDVPFVFKLGQGSVIAGWDKGLVGMTKGSHRRLEIPSKMGYGEQNVGPIPANSDLYFDVELLEVFSEADYGKYTSKTDKAGTGKGAKDGDKISVHYTGTFLNGKKFDSSKDRNTPFTITLGAKQVITGWDKGLVGIKTGEIRTLLIMPGAAYGKRGAGQVIPSDMPIKFEVECLSINE